MARRMSALVLACGLAAAAPFAQSQPPQQSGYLTPPKEIVEILDAEPLPTVTVGPQRELIALMQRRSMPAIEEISEPMLRLAGARINPDNNGPHRAGSGIGLTLRSITSGDERKVVVPEGARIGDVSFSPDGKWLSFTNTRDTRVDLHIADVATGQSRLVEPAVNAAASGCEWLDDSSGLLCGFVPARRGPPPRRTARANKP